MNTHIERLHINGIILVLPLLASCGGAPSTIPPSATLESPLAPSPTCTASPPTATSAPTQPALPPTPMTLPSTAHSGGQPTHTVCASGCDFNTIQAALDDEATTEGAIIEVQDSVHTEAGIAVSKDVTIRGLGIDQTIVQAHTNPDQAPDRVFLIERGTTAVLESMTIRHGKPAVQDQNGGGLRNLGSLTMRSCLVTDNRANGGGGISNSGDLILINSTVSSNLANGIAPLGLECGNGGGIQCGSGNLLVYNSTVSYNQAGEKGRARGGGIFVGCSCQATLVNSTISGNHASRESGREYDGGDSLGGGIAVAGDLQLIQSTISHNVADHGGGGINAWGRVSFLGSIIANNTGQEGDCLVTRVGEIVSNLYTLIESGGCGAMLSGDPYLGPLGSNGGPTETHALSPDSPLIDAVPADYCYLLTDQRGKPRPVSAAHEPPLCDIGAYEFQP
jgi:hypothetical protein